MRNAISVRARSILVTLLVVSAVVLVVPKLANAGVYVSVEGDKVDENGQPFTDPRAIVDPYGIGSTCGPDAATQSTLYGVCGGPVPHYVARARWYLKGYVRMTGRIPIGRDVVISVCTGSDATFGCRTHPADSFCRPKQSSSSTKVYVYLPPTLPPFVDIQWKYIPESQAGSYLPCDKKGPYQAKVLSAELR